MYIMLNLMWNDTLRKSQAAAWSVYYYVRPSIRNDELCAAFLLRIQTTLFNQELLCLWHPHIRKLT